MTYIILSVVVLALIAVATVPTLRRLPLQPLGLAALGLIALTAIFDNVIVGIGIVEYEDSLTSGIRLWHAPIEDFAYAIGAAMLIPAVWTWMGRLSPKRPKVVPAPADSTSTRTRTRTRTRTHGGQS